jgi:hypothetical protein
MSYESNAEALYQQTHALRDHLVAYQQEHQFSLAIFSSMLLAISAEFAMHAELQRQQAHLAQASRLIKPEIAS